MLKEGQLYSYKKADLRMVVTRIYSKKADAICSDGSVLSGFYVNSDFKDWNLIAEFEDWVTAVNSDFFLKKKVIEVEVKKKEIIYKDPSFKTNLFNEDLELIEQIKEITNKKDKESNA